MAKNKLGNLVLIIGLVIVAVILALNKPVSEKDKLSVVGFSELSIAPDKAELYIAVETTEDTAQESQDANSEISDAVIAALEQAGAENIETESYSIYPKENYREEYELLGYTTRHTIKVTTTETTETGKYVDAAVNAGANRVERISFTLSEEKEKEVKSQLLDMAGQDAQQKAEAIADNMNVRLGKIISISESNVNIQPMYYRAEALAADTQIAPQNVETTARLSVVYQI